MKKLITFVAILIFITTFAQPNLSPFEQEGTNFLRKVTT